MLPSEAVSLEWACLSAHVHTPYLKSLTFLPETEDPPGSPFTASPLLSLLPSTRPRSPSLSGRALTWAPNFQLLPSSYMRGEWLFLCTYLLNVYFERLPEKPARKMPRTTAQNRPPLKGTDTLTLLLYRCPVFRHKSRAVSSLRAWIRTGFHQAI